VNELACSKQLLPGCGYDILTRRACLPKPRVQASSKLQASPRYLSIASPLRSQLSARDASTPNQTSRTSFKARLDVPDNALGDFDTVFGPLLPASVCVGSEMRQAGDKPAERDKKRHLSAHVLFVATSSRLFDLRSHASKRNICLATTKTL
jgi:hypothetical protein